MINQSILTKNVRMDLQQLKTLMKLDSWKGQHNCMQSVFTTG